MNSPYFASRNHSRRFSFAGSWAALKGCATDVGEAALKGCATDDGEAALTGCATDDTEAALTGCATDDTEAALAGCVTDDAEAALKGCATDDTDAALTGCVTDDAAATSTSGVSVAQAFRPALIVSAAAPTVSAIATVIRGRMSTSESDARRQLNHTRRPRRIRNADRRAEIRVDLRAVHVEPRSPVDVLEFHLVEQVVDFRAELQRAGPGEHDVLEDREVGVDDTGLPHDVARSIAVTAAGRSPERCRVEEAGQRIAAARERISGEDRAHHVQTRLGGAREAPASSRFTAGEVEVVGRREGDVRPVAGDEVVLARHLPAIQQHPQRSGVPARQIPRVVDHQAVAVALNELRVEKVLRAIECVR